MNYRADNCIVDNDCLGQYCYHHILTKKTSGSDEDWNLLPLCIKHHNEVHNSGMAKLALEHFKIRAWLTKNGWKWNGAKWQHPKDNRFRKESFNSYR